MYEPLRIAAAVEGPTDAIMLRAILRALLPDDADFVFQTLQPERSAAFGSASFGATGAGWVGVFHWSRQSAQEGGGSVSGCSALSFHDVLIVHVDADVAGKTYASGGIQDAPRDDLPCEEPCPPPDRTTNNLRAVVLNWLGRAWMSTADCPMHAVQEHGSLGAGRNVAGKRDCSAGRLGVPRQPGRPARGLAQAPTVQEESGRLSTHER